MCVQTQMNNMTDIYVEVGFKSGVVKTVCVTDVTGDFISGFFNKDITHLNTDCGVMVIRSEDVSFINIVYPKNGTYSVCLPLSAGELAYAT